MTAAEQAGQSGTDHAYPEHEKLRAVSDESQAIGEFLDVGLGRMGLSLAEIRPAGNNGKQQFRWKGSGRHPARYATWDDYIDGKAETNPDYESWGESYVPASRSIQAILAGYFEIDLDKIEAEKRAMLDALRAMNA